METSEEATGLGDGVALNVAGGDWEEGGVLQRNQRCDVKHVKSEIIRLPSRDAEQAYGCKCGIQGKDMSGDVIWGTTDVYMVFEDKEVNEPY